MPLPTEKPSYVFTLMDVFRIKFKENIEGLTLLENLEAVNEQVTLGNIALKHGVSEALFCADVLPKEVKIDLLIVVKNILYRVLTNEKHRLKHTPEQFNTITCILGTLTVHLCGNTIDGRYLRMMAMETDYLFDTGTIGHAVVCFAEACFQLNHSQQYLFLLSKTLKIINELQEDFNTEQHLQVQDICNVFPPLNKKV